MDECQIANALTYTRLVMTSRVVFTDNFRVESFPGAFQMSGQLTRHQFSPVPTSC